MNRAEKRRQRRLAEKNQRLASSRGLPAGNTPEIQQALDLGIQHHMAGDLGKAEGLYQQVLQADPKQPVALHLLGVIAHQVSRNDIAVDLIGKAVAIRPGYAEAHSNLGLALQGLGKPDQAAASYHQAITIKPDYAEAHNNLGNALRQLGKLDEAVASYDKALAIKRDFAEAHANLGDALADLGRLDEAVASYHKALAINPGYAEAHSGLGNALRTLGRMDEAAASYQKALIIKPDFAEAHSNLGNTLQDLGRLDEAVASCRKALTIKPDFAEAHYNFGNALNAQGKPDEALGSYRKALAIKPGFAEAHSNLGNALKDLGEPIEAVASYQKAIALKPDFTEAHYNLGVVLHDQGLLDDAVASYHKALALKPDFTDAHYNLGNALKELERLDEAAESYHKAIALKPDYAEAHNNLGDALKQLMRMDEAAASCHKALTIKPDYAEAHYNLGNVLKDLGRLDTAMASYRQALAIKPDLTAAHSNLLFTQNYVADQSSAELLADARRYGAAVAAMATPVGRHANTADPDRRLRVGLVSGDLRTHSVAYFLCGFLAEIDREKIDFFAYSSSSREDGITAKIKANVGKWQRVAGKSDAQLCQDIVDDGIDILVDLSSHTANNRLSVFAWKPAPIQATWLGYFATTGVKEIDYILCDRWVLPPAEEDQFVEAPIRLPDSYLCFTPPDLDMDMGPLPAQTNGYITFGCFNNLSKVNEQVVSCWAKLLHGVPDSRLSLIAKQLEDAAVRQEMLGRFSARGISADRLMLEGFLPRAELFAAYQEVDICLDPFPYPGGTTSVEAMWMGVPVVTLQGNRFLSHVGESILHTVGLDDWIAPTLDIYVETAQKHASNLPALATLRGRLRERLVASPMCDAPRFARNLEDAFRGMWRTWCQSESRPSLEQ